MSETSMHRLLLAAIAACLTISAALTPAVGRAHNFAPLPPPTIGFIAFSAFVDGNWDIYALAPGGTHAFRLTSHPAEDLEPAFSPDGHKLAFSSRRDGNWEIYVLDEAGKLARLTHDQSFDGAPAWSPDGRYIAFESYRAGDLDIWVMKADGTEPRNLTADDPAGDCDPAWSPDGRYIAFSSWRYGDKDIFILDVETGEVVQLTEEITDEDSPVWSPDGKRIAYVRESYERREVWVLEVEEPPAQGGRAHRITWLTRDEAPVWLPDGRLAFVSRRYDGDRIMAGSKGNEVKPPEVWLGPAFLGKKLAFAEGIELKGAKVSKESLETRRVPPGREKHRLEALPDVDTYVPKLSDAVADSFNELRRRVQEESGYDFLGRLSEAWRPLDFHHDYSEYASWHKAGRAFDTLLDFNGPGGIPLMEVVREDMGGETFWRIFIRCARQDGTCGRPMETHPWDFSYKARVIVAPEEGGQWKPIPYGYYVDFTRLAREQGWERISAFDDEDFSWRWHFKAVEYWHYQKRDGLTWYQAMQELYPSHRVEELFSWDAALEKGEAPYLMRAKGIPVPAAYKIWLMLKP